VRDRLVPALHARHVGPHAVEPEIAMRTSAGITDTSASVMSRPSSHGPPLASIVWLIRT